MRKWLLISFGNVLIAVLAATLCIRALLAPELNAPSIPSYPQPLNRLQANLQDLDYLSKFTSIDRSFSEVAREEFHNNVEKLRADASHLNIDELEAGAAQAVALANNAHTNVRRTSWGRSTNSIPLRMVWFGDRLYIVKADCRYLDLIGKEVMKIDGKPVKWLLRYVAAYVGGPENFRKEKSSYFFVAPAFLRAIGIGASPDIELLGIRDRAGVASNHLIHAVHEPITGHVVYGANNIVLQQNHWPARDLSPIPAPGNTRKWCHILDGKRLPLYLQKPNSFYWEKDISVLNALYIQINATQSEGGRIGLSSFLQRAVERIQKKSYRNAIVDLRFNPGGDYDLTLDFTSALPAALPDTGHLFIITSANTFSAGIITAARLKYFAGRKAVIVGQRIGDREEFWAEGYRVVLPNSKIPIMSAVGYHNWKSGCSLSEIRYCYLFNYLYGVVAGDLSPTMPTKLNFQVYRAGDDGAMEAIAHYLGGTGRVKQHADGKK